MSQKLNVIVGISLMIIFAVMAVFFVKVIGEKQAADVPVQNDNIVLPKLPSHRCTEEAKICPDGSSVGRTGPDCEFAPCPGKNDCIKEGESIGAVYPGVEVKECCAGLVPVVPKNIVGTRGICQKTNIETVQ